MRPRPKQRASLHLKKRLLQRQRRLRRSIALRLVKNVRGNPNARKELNNLSAVGQHSTMGISKSVRAVFGDLPDATCPSNRPDSDGTDSGILLYIY